MTEGNQHDEDYEVGYGKPPKEHQFQKGQSGNPKGRPKKSDLNAANLIEGELLKSYRLTVDGRIQELPAVQVMIKAIMAKAMQGDVKAAHFLKPYVNQAVRKGQLQNEREEDLETEQFLEDFQVFLKQLERAKRGPFEDENGLLPGEKRNPRT